MQEMGGPDLERNALWAHSLHAHTERGDADGVGVAAGDAQHVVTDGVIVQLQDFPSDSSIEVSVEIALHRHLQCLGGLVMRGFSVDTGGCRFDVHKLNTI